MTGFRYIASRLNGDGTETFLDFDLPLSDVAITDTLSGADTLTAKISPQVARMVGPDGLPLFRRWETAIYAEAAGEIRSGVILKDMSAAGPDLSLDGVGFSDYPRGMPYDGDRSGVQVDPMDEARHIWAHLQAKPGGNLAMVLDATKSSTRIGTASTEVEFTTGGGEDVSFEAGPYVLAWWKTHDLGAELENLAKAAPFDFIEHHTWSGETTIAHRLQLGTPTIGRRRDDLRFVIGENVSVVPQVDFGDESYATEVMVLGAGEGRKMVRGNAGKATQGLRRVAVVTKSSLTSASAAVTEATAQLRARIAAGDVSEIKVYEHPHAPVGSWSVGDEVLLQGEAGWGGDLNLWVRVLSTTISPESGETAALQVARVDRVGD